MSYAANYCKLTSSVSYRGDGMVGSVKCIGEGKMQLGTTLGTDREVLLDVRHEVQPRPMYDIRYGQSQCTARE